MNNILTISGQRGGSGKSVTALNLAVCLSLYEKKVLLVDCDPQGTVTGCSGVGEIGYPFDLSDVLWGKASLIEAVSNTEFNTLDILPARFDLFRISLKLSRLAANEKILRLLLDEVRSDYDFIILDAPSSFGYLSIAALTAADRIWVSLCPSLNLGQDIRDLFQCVEYIRQSHNVDVSVAGILFNRCQGKDMSRAFIKDQNIADAQKLICPVSIPEDHAVQEACRKQMPLALYDIKSAACQGYLAFAEEIIEGFQRI